MNDTAMATRTVPVKDRATVTRWDEQYITGTVACSDIIAIGLSLSNRPLGHFEGESDNVTFAGDSFAIRTEFVPASCVPDLKIAIHHSDGAISHIVHP